MSNVTARHTAPRTASSSNLLDDYDNGKQKQKSNIPLYIVAVFVFICFGIIAFGTTEENALVSEAIRDHKDEHHPNMNYKETNVRRAKSTNNPYDGWQPAPNLARDLGQKDCKSWRTCFVANKDDKCSGKCRDSPDDFGVAPPRPGFTPDPNADDAANNENAQKVPWVPDVTVLRRMLKAGKDEHGNPWPPPLVTETDRELCEEIGNFGGNNDENAILLNKVPIRGMPLLSEWSQAAMTTKKMKRQPKVMCMVYTMEEQHATRIRSIRETWAPGCDGFLAFSTRDDPRIPAISLPHDGVEEYGNMWQKIRSIWRFVGTHYLDDFDFFFQGGEDLYVMPQNLRSVLADMVEDPTKDDFFGGRRFKWGAQDIYFNSGGAGYALSQATLRKFFNTGLDHPKCFPDKRSSMEDVFIARCLKDVFDIGIVDTRDDNERERFHPFAPAAHYNWKPPKEGKRDWYFNYNIEWLPKLKEECCAPDSVSFHYIKKPAMVRHLHALLYFCD